MFRRHSRLEAAMLASAGAFHDCNARLGRGWGGGWGAAGVALQTITTDRVDAGRCADRHPWIIGGIAAIAPAPPAIPTSAERDRRREDDRRYPDEPYRTTDPGAGYG